MTDLHHLDYTFTAGRSTGGKVVMTLTFWTSTQWQTARLELGPREAMDFFRKGIGTVMAAHPDIELGDLEGEVERGRRQLEGDGDT